MCGLLGVGCQGHSSATPRVVRSTLQTNGVKGMSGVSATATPGVFLAVAERRPLVLTLRLDASGELVLAKSPTPLVGLPEGLDLESITRLDATRYAIGTEIRRQRSSEGSVMIVELGEDEARVLKRVELPYALWNLRANENEGLEGMCAAGPHVLVGVETVATGDDGIRRAPLALGTLEMSGWTPMWLRLSTETGKVSSLECWVEQGHIELIAIERHFGVGRLVWFRLPVDDIAPNTTLEPYRVVDLTPHIHPLPNLESIVRLDSDTVLLVSDNQGTTTSGPTFVFVIQLSHSAAMP